MGTEIIFKWLINIHGKGATPKCKRDEREREGERVVNQRGNYLTPQRYAIIFIAPKSRQSLIF